MGVWAGRKLPSFSLDGAYYCLAGSHCETTNGSSVLVPVSLPPPLLLFPGLVFAALPVLRLSSYFSYLRLESQVLRQKGLLQSLVSEVHCYK